MVIDTLTVTPHGVLWFASVPQVERSIRQQLAEHAEVSHVVVDLHAVSRLDYSGAASLARIVEELRAAEVRVEIVNVNPGARRGVRVFIDGLDD